MIKSYPSQQRNTKKIVLWSVGVAVLIVIGTVGYIVTAARSSHNKNDPAMTTPLATQQYTSVDPNIKIDEPRLLWKQDQNGWTPDGKVPNCDAKLNIKVPADITKVTSVLYPGQTRGGDYKSHGGFRFDGSDNSVTVITPIDGYIVRGGRYLVEGEVQYTFDIMNNCGVMFRVDHLRALTDMLQKIADTWPEPVEGDSPRIQAVSPAVEVKTGNILAVKIGIVKNNNVFFDFGVYDYRSLNLASKSDDFQAAHVRDKELSWRAVCWLDWLTVSDRTQLLNLPPGDPTSGKKSDYCKY